MKKAAPLLKELLKHIKISIWKFRTKALVTSDKQKKECSMRKKIKWTKRREPLVSKLIKSFLLATTVVLLPSIATQAATNNIIVWTGASGNIWNTTDQNWRLVSGGSPVIFQNGDIVTFNSGVGGSVIVDIGGVITSSLYVSGDKDYFFTGGNLTTDGAAGSFSGASAADGRLTVGGAAYTSNSISKTAYTGTMDLTGTTSNTFKNGVEIYSGTLRINSAAQLGATMNKLGYTGPASYATVVSLANAIATGDATAASTATTTARTTKLPGF